MRKTSITLLALMTVLLFSCKDPEKDKTDPTNPGAPTLTADFEDGGYLPYNCGKDNGNISPMLSISNIPENTVEMVLTMRDIDNGNSWHWAIWDIPPTKSNIAEGETWGGLSVTKGNNDYGTNYVGPFPPSVHRYKITVYFLNEDISLTSSQYKQIPTSISGKVISEVSITGKYD